MKWLNKNNTTSFWSEVYNYRDAGGNNKFKEISEFVLKLLCLPWSNADVERVFSQMNLVKSNIRNRLNLITVNSVLSIRQYEFLRNHSAINVFFLNRYGLKRIDKCCFQYEVPKNYLKLIGSNECYDDNNNEIDIDDNWGFNSF